VAHGIDLRDVPCSRERVQEALLRVQAHDGGCTLVISAMPPLDGGWKVGLVHPSIIHGWMDETSPPQGRVNVGSSIHLKSINPSLHHLKSIDPSPIAIAPNPHSHIVSPTID